MQLKKAIPLLRSHIFGHTQKFLEIGWDVLPNLTYSPDITPSDYF